MLSMIRVVLVTTIAFVLSGGCATSFTGSATVNRGAAGCRAKCTAEHLEFAGMIMLGEYSDGCICTAPGKTLTHAERNAAAGSAGSAAGVVMQMRQAEQARQAGGYR